jgi:hypothetical protein
MSSAVLVADREEAELRSATFDVLKRLRGRATVADIVAATGLAQARAEIALRSLLATHTGHVEVGERGDLVYAFDPHLLTRDHVPLWRRMLSGARRVAKTVFKAWIALMLVAYFIVFLTLAIAAIVVVIARRGGDDMDFDMRHGRNFSFNWLWFLFWAPDWRWGTPYYGQRAQRRFGKKERVPFYKKVFAFVFGPDQPKPAREELDRDFVQLIRSRNGVITAADLVMQTGTRFDEAHQELGRLMGAFNGEARATEDGEVVYLFPDLMVSAHGAVQATPPEPAWRRLLEPRSLTGNTTGANLAIVGINSFNLAGVAFASIAIPSLAPTSSGLWAGLVWVPLAFSALFFAIPLIRIFATHRENARRRAKNLRSVVLGNVMEAALEGRELTRDDVIARVRSALGAATHSGDIAAVLNTLAAELDADIGPGEDGLPRFGFTGLRRQLEAGGVVRRTLRYEQRRVGAVVYSSADEPEEQGRRDLETFDRELRTALAPERVAFAEPF